MDSGMGGGSGLGSASGSIELDASKALAALNQFSAGLRNVSKQSQSMGTGLLGFASQYQQQFTTMGTGLLGVGAAITGAFGLMANTAASFEQQMSAVGSVTGATGKSLSALREEALRLGADTSFSASEAAQAMEVMAKAGVSVQDILAGATEDIMNLATATGADVPQAAEVASAAMNVFGVSAEEAANVISRSANVSALDVNDWALAMKSAGPVAAALGYDIDDLAAAMIILGDAGTSGEVAATALRNIMINMADPAGEAAEALAQYGVAATNVDGSVRELDAVTADLATTWGTLTDAERLQLAQSVAGRDGAAAFMTIMDAQTQAVQNNSNAFDDNKARMGEVGTASEQAAQRLDNFRGSWDQLMGTVETISITFGSTVLPVLRAVVDGVNTLLQGVLSLPAPLQTAIMGLTGIAGAAALGAGGFLLLLPRIAETRSALLDLSKAPGIVGRVSSGILSLGTSAAGATTRVGGLRGALMGLTRAHPVLTGLGLIAGGLYAAYRTNFLGIGDLVDGLKAKVSGVFSAMRDAFNASGESASIAADDVATFAEATDVVDGVTVYTAFKTNAAGEKEAVGEIIESYKNADGMTAQVLIQGDAGQYWATIDLATGEISNAEIPVTANTKPFSERLNDALEVLEDRFNEAGMGWAASVVDNVQGIVSTVSNMANKLRTVFTALSPRVKDFLSQIAAATVVLAPLGAGIGLVVKALSTLSPVLTMARVAIQGIGLAIAVLTSPIGLIVVGIAALAAGLIYAYNHFESFRNVVDSVVDTVKGFWDAISSGEALDKLQQMSDSVQQWFQDTADSIMSGISETWDAITNSVTDALNGARDIVSGIWDGISSGVGAAWDAIQNGISLAWNAITSLNWSDWINPLNWADWIVGKIGDFAGWIWEKIQAYFPAAALITDAIGNFATWIWGKISTYFPSTSLITDAIGSFTTWVWGKIETFFPSASLITDAIGNFATWVWGKISSYFPSASVISGSISDFGTWLYEKIGSPKLSLPGPGEILSAIVDAITGRGSNGSTNTGKADDATWGVNQGAGGIGGVGGASGGGIGQRTPIGGDMVPLVGMFDNIAAAAGRAAAAVLPVNTNVAALAGQSAAVTAFGGAATSAFLTSGGAAQTGLSPIAGIAASMAAGLTGAAIPAFAGIQASAITNFAGMLSAVASNTASASSTAGTNASSMNAKVAGEMAGMQVKSAAQMVLLAASAASNFSTMQTAATTAGSRMAQEMTNGATRALSGVRSALSQIPGIVSSIGGSAAATARNVGAMIGVGMAQGMESMLGRIRAAANAMVVAAETALAARARLGSPSKLFRQMGAWVGEGFELGIRSLIPDVARAAAAMVSVPGIGGNVYSNGYTPAYAYATAPGGVVVNNYHHHHTEYIALSTSDLQRLTEQAERGATYARTMSQPDAFTQWLGGS